MVDWGTGWIFSANAEFVWTRHFRQYGHLTYGFKGSGDTADKNFPIETFSTGPELFFRPFYIGVGLGSVWAPWVNFRQSDETKPTGEVGTLTSERFLEFPIGLEFRVAKDYYIHVDLTREIWT
jgi:hypothetical protein